MPRDITVTFEDGSSHVYKGAPDAITPEQVAARAAKDFGKTVTHLDGGNRSYSDASPQTSERAGYAIKDIPRQVGLTARYGLEGVAQLADTFAAPIREFVVNPAARLLGLPAARSLTAEAGRAADAVGLPAPQTPDERVIGDAARTMAGAGGMAGASRIGANAASGLAKEVLTRMGANAGAQISAGAGAGAAGGSVREAGGDPIDQFVAAVLGGLAGGVGASAATSAAARAKAAVTPQTVKTATADQQIAMTLERQGIDWSQIPERVRQSVRKEVSDALATGDSLNADALRRLLAFRNTGTTPTVGMLTQNPAQITREMNLAKTGANSIDPALQKLPMVQNQNAAILLRNLDEAGAARAPDAMGAGQSAVGALRSRVASEQGRINSLYQQARDTGGRSLPLESGTFAQRANSLLDAENVGSFLPTDIANKMNAIATGKFPLTVDVAEQLKTSIGNLQRGSADGNVRRALGLVRQALDETPLQNAGRAGGNQVGILGQIPQSVQAGEQSIAAFNAARSANRQWMQRIEGNPALKAVVDGVEPDQFISRFVVGKGATAKDVASLRAELGPQAVADLKGYLVRHLRDAATNSTDDITKFSNDAYRRALRDIGDDKLKVFFSPAEIQKLKDIGAAAKYMQAQPVGSAVNNSNTGGLLLGRLMDLTQKAGQVTPFGGREIITGLIQGQQQAQTLNPLLALRQPVPTQGINPLFPSIFVGPQQDRKDDRSN